MASNIPTQVRITDPFVSYNSNAVNKISRNISKGENGLLYANSLQVTSVSSTKVNVSSGFAIKDDVLIKIIDDYEVDFTDASFYYDPLGVLPQENGYHYIVLQYTYQKSKPAPQAEIKILKPSERDLVDDFILLKVIEIDSLYPHDILNIIDVDPEYPTNERQFIKYYNSSEHTLPSFLQSRDQGRLVYIHDENTYYLGFSERWVEITPEGVTVVLPNDTTGVEVGMVCYVDTDRTPVPSIANGLNTYGADVLINYSSGSSYEGLIVGYAQVVLVEDGVSIQTGDNLYLSSVNPGKVTNIRTSPVYQFLGRSLNNGNSAVPISAIFYPKSIMQDNLKGTITEWNYNGINYYSDIDVSILNASSSFLSNWYDSTTLISVDPLNIEIRDSGDTLRVTFDSTANDISYIILAGQPTEELPIVDDHPLLTNLSYASSGHTGFVPNPHGNANHSETYITASSVTFETFNTNGDVGSSSGQLAIGNHTHTGLVDIPAGSIITFYENTVVTGYTLLPTSDQLIYITKGSAAGGEVGGSIKSGSTWSQPVHTHTTLADSGHVHTTLSHTLTIAEIPSHRHYLSSGEYIRNVNQAILNTTCITPIAANTSYTGGGGAHSHGNAVTSGGHTHNISSETTINTWRPRGNNFTRQQRI